MSSKMQNIGSKTHIRKSEASLLYSSVLFIFQTAHIRILQFDLLKNYCTLSALSSLNCTVFRVNTVQNKILRFNLLRLYSVKAVRHFKVILIVNLA